MKRNTHLNLVRKQHTKRELSFVFLKYQLSIKVALSPLPTIIAHSLTYSLGLTSQLNLVSPVQSSPVSLVQFSRVESSRISRSIAYSLAHFFAHECKSVSAPATCVSVCVCVFLCSSVCLLCVHNALLVFS